MQPSPMSPQPVVVERGTSRFGRLLVLPISGAAALFAFTSIGVAAQRLGAGVELEPVRLLPAGATVLGIPAPIESLLVPSPSTGVLLVALEALLSIGLIWLGHHLDWGTRPLASGPWGAALHRVYSAPRRMRSQLGIRVARLAPHQTSRPLPAYATPPTYGQTRRRAA